MPRLHLVFPLSVLYIVLSSPTQLSAVPQSGPCDTTVGGAWTELGPSPFLGINPEGGLETISGQVSAIAVDLANDRTGNTVYVGSSSGGVWKSTNGLSPHPSFNPISDQAQSLSVGAIALDTRTNPPVIFVGTGAPDNSANISSYTGVGILISADGGRSWRPVDSADGGAHPFAGQGFSSILIDPDNPNIMLASTGIGVDPNFPAYSLPQGSTAADHFGIFRSMDGGNTWARVKAITDSDPIIPANGFFHTELLFEPTQRTYFAGVSKQGLFQSTDRGATWSSLASLGLGNGLPAAGGISRISLTTRNGVLWALLLTNPFATSHAFQLFESDDHAKNWKQIPLPALDLFKGALMYVAAPPNSEGLVLATQSIFRTDNISAPNPAWLDIEHNLHGDQHAIAFASSTNWYVGDDGGAWATTKRGDAWTSLNDDLRTLEMFGADGDSGGSAAMAGGAQDNGPMETGGSPEWQQLFLDDGMYAAADPRKPGAFFVSAQFGDIRYVPSSLAPPVSIITLAGDFLAPFEILPSDSRLFSGGTGFGINFSRARFLLAGALNLQLITFDPDATTSKTTILQLTSTINSKIQFVAPVPSDPTTAFAVAGPTLFRVSNIGFGKAAVVTPINGGPVDGTHFLGHLAVSPTQPATLYVLKVGFVNGEKVFRSDDGGSTWTNISGNLPNVAVNWITVDPANPDFIFLGTDIGAFVATDGGAQDEQWQMLGSGLPHVPVTQLKIQPGRKLLAATYGRNVWQLDISHLFHVPALQYAAKFMCGKPEGDAAAAGAYFTSVNVHNPQPAATAFRKKFAIALPNEKGGEISKFFTARLCPDEAFAITCKEILARTPAPGATFLDGFVVLESDTDLDVVATYTASGATRQVETLEMERVSSRREVVATGKADLVPQFNCHKVTGQIIVTIKNAGEVAAPVSTTSLAVVGDGTLSQLTLPIAAGGSVDIAFDTPPSCVGAGCRFVLTADSGHEIDESNETNNILEGVCSQ